MHGAAVLHILCGAVAFIISCLSHQHCLEQQTHKFGVAETATQHPFASVAVVVVVVATCGHMNSRRVSSTMYSLFPIAAGSTLHFRRAERNPAETRRKNIS